jgi:thioesterase domain-containing protein
MRKLPNGGSIVLRVKVRDRFGDYGLVGLVVADVRSNILVVETLLLSCRVLGRGVEHGILRHLGDIAIERGLSQVNLAYLPTPRNEPARAFAESIAASFRKQEGDQVIYCIPAQHARAISHRPGHDPAAVVEAQKSEGNKHSTSNSHQRTSPSSANRSQRYERLARTFVSGRDVLRAERTANKRARTLPNEPVKPATDIEDRLLALWEEALGLDGLGVEDDYFALGGSSLVAARLFAEIARQFGVKLPLTSVLESRTVRRLSRHLEPQPMEHSGTLVELRRGGPRNLFLVHDGDGETLLYLNLAHRMPSDLAVFGIEPHRMAGVPLAHARIEDMAAFYIDQVRKKQSHGPYLLGGMCAGGVIAYEMASQLVRAGERVELVAILDAATPQAAKRPGRITRQRLGRMAQAFASVRNSQRSRARRALAFSGTIARKLVNAFMWEIMRRGTQWSVRARFRLLRELLARGMPWPRFIPELSVRQIYDTAETHYRPMPLSGTTLVLARAQTGEGGDTPYCEIYSDETLGWAAVTNTLAVIDVEGGHSSMLQQPFVDSLTAALTPYLSHEPEPVYVTDLANPNMRNWAEIKDFVPHP